VTQNTHTIRSGDRVRLDSSTQIFGTVLQTQSPRCMLKVHGKADHPGLCLVKWDNKGGEHWYEPVHLVVVEPAIGKIARIAKFFTSKSKS